MPHHTRNINRPQGSSLKPLLAMAPFLRPYLGIVLLALVALLLASGAFLALPVAVRQVIDFGFSTADAATIDRYFIIFLGIALLFGIFGAARTYLVNWLGERVAADLRKKVYERVIRLDLTFFEVTKTGEVLSRLAADTTLIQAISGSGISIILRSSIQFGGALVLIAVTNPRLMGYLVILVPAVLAPILAVGRWVRRLSRASQDRIAEASGLAGETLNAIQTVQAFTAEKLLSRRFGEMVETSFLTAVRRIRARALFSTVATTGLFGALILVLWIGAWAVLNGEMTGGELGQFVLYALVVAMSAASLSEVWGELQQAAGAMERLLELLNAQPALDTPENPTPLPDTRNGSIRFDNISFSYPSRPDVQAIKNFDLEISPGEKVAFVGPSGAGKSTAFQLLLRFYFPQTGRIIINGVDIAQARPEDVRTRVGIVPQETVIFGASARENIRFGRPGSTDDEIEAAARAAAADAFIRQLPQGYDSFLGERGTRLSGGQKQRIAIARAILKDPPILLLDEATSSLDAESERLVQEALERLAKGRTTIVIAHRLATVLKADRIVVINKGSIIDIGRHGELVARNALYAKLAELQFL
jgi:ATP-binding cassette subfamily B protein